MKRGTPPMTHNFWAYGTVVKSSPHKKIVIKKIAGGVKGGDKISFVSLIFFRALKLSFISFFLDSLSLKGVDLEIDVSLGVGVSLRSLSLNREGVEVT